MPSPSERVTIGDIAKALDVSKATVSWALRDNPKVKPATRERVKAKALELGYVPHPHFRQLAALRKTGADPASTIALIVGRERNRVREDSYISAVDRAEELGYHTEILFSGDHPDPLRLADILYNRGVEGLLLTTYSNFPAGEDFPWERFAVVAAGDRNEHYGVDVVRANPFDTVAMLWERLLEAGWRGIGGYFPHDPPEPSRMDAKCMGAFLYLQSLLPEADRVPLCGPEMFDKESFREWYRRYRPEAIISLTQTAWVEDGYFSADLPRPVFLSTKGNPGARVAGANGLKEEVPRAAVDVLDSKLRAGRFGRSVPAQTVVLNPVWRDGETFWRKGEVGFSGGKV